MDVVLLRWPEESERRSRLQADCVPRLLLVEDESPPEPSDCLEDWIRLPVGEDEVRTRISWLTNRADAHGAGSHQLPRLDVDGVLRFRSSWVSLPPVEYRITRALIDRYRAVVGREALARAGWPQGAPGRNALDVHVLRLRRRLCSVGLCIKTVRSRGYLLEPSSAEDEITPPSASPPHPPERDRYPAEPPALPAAALRRDPRGNGS